MSSTGQTSPGVAQSTVLSSQASCSTLGAGIDSPPTSQQPPGLDLTSSVQSRTDPVLVERLDALVRHFSEFKTYLIQQNAYLVANMEKVLEALDAVQSTTQEDALALEQYAHEHKDQLLQPGALEKVINQLFDREQGKSLKSDQGSLDSEDDDGDSNDSEEHEVGACDNKSTTTTTSSNKNGSSSFSMNPTSPVAIKNSTEDKPTKSVASTRERLSPVEGIHVSGPSPPPLGGNRPVSTDISPSAAAAAVNTMDRHHRDKIRRLERMYQAKQLRAREALGGQDPVALRNTPIDDLDELMTLRGLPASTGGHPNTPAPPARRVHFDAATPATNATWPNSNPPPTNSSSIVVGDGGSYLDPSAVTNAPSSHKRSYDALRDVPSPRGRGYNKRSRSFQNEGGRGYNDGTRQRYDSASKNVVDEDNDLYEEPDAPSIMSQRDRNLLRDQDERLLIDLQDGDGMSWNDSGDDSSVMDGPRPSYRKATTPMTRYSSWQESRAGHAYPSAKGWTPTRNHAGDGSNNDGPFPPSSRSPTMHRRGYNKRTVPNSNDM